MNNRLLNHPGRWFISDGVAAKNWQLPITIDESPRHPGVFRLRDRNCVVIRRFRRLRYATLALQYLCELKGAPVPDEDDVLRMIRRELFKRNEAMHLTHEATKAYKRQHRVKVKQARTDKARAFWGKLGMEPPDA